MPCRGEKSMSKRIFSYHEFRGSEIKSANPVRAAHHGTPVTHEVAGSGGDHIEGMGTILVFKLTGGGPL